MAQPAERAVAEPAVAGLAGAGPAGVGSTAVGSATAMGIGGVLAVLQREFPDVTVSKIRFLETEGLVAPARTRSGYRRFTEDDVDRLRWVLRAQRDRYLPLRVIRTHLDAVGTGTPTDPAGEQETPSAGTAPAPSPGVVPAAPARSRRLHREELIEAAGLTPQTLVEMESFGLVRSRSGWYDADDVVVAHTVARLAVHGVAPRHLRGLRSAADREVGLLEQVIAPQLRQRRPDARARAEETATELRDLTRRLHDALVSGAMRDIGLDSR